MFKVLANSNGELLGESTEYRGASIMQELFALRGIPCNVQPPQREQRKQPVSKMARLHVELLESRK